jgi:hypothetical protein
MGGRPDAAWTVWEGGNAGKFGFVPICYIKIAACKQPALCLNILGKYE